MGIIVKPRLMSILRDRGLTQAEFSILSGVEQATISRFDKNTRHDDVLLFKIARALDITVDELFEVKE